MQIVAITGLRYSPVHAAIDLFEAGGLAAIRHAIRGRSRGNGCVLSPVQEETIQRMVIEQATGATQDGLQLVESRRKKPIKRAYEQGPEAVQNWLQGEYPACRFPFKLALLIFQLALVTLSPCHPPRSRCSRRIPIALLSSDDSAETLDTALRPGGNDSLNGSNARLCQLKGPERRDGQTPLAGSCERSLAAQARELKNPQKCRWQVESPEVTDEGKPTPGQNTGQVLDPRQGIAATTFYDQIKAFFAECADVLRGQGDAMGAERFTNASTHWMRHSHASHALAGGMRVEIAQQNLGHSSLATPTVHVTTEKRRRMKAVETF